MEISAMSAYVSRIHNKFSQKRLKAVKADVFEIIKGSVIFNIKKYFVFKANVKSYVIFSAICRKSFVPVGSDTKCLV